MKKRVASPRGHDHTVCSIVTTSCVGVLKASTIIQKIQTELDELIQVWWGCYCIVCTGYGLTSSSIWFWKCQDCYKGPTISGYKGQGTGLCWLSKKLFCSQDDSEFVGIDATKERLYGAKAEDLMKRWNIGLKKVIQTIQVTTQRGIQTILHPTLARRFRTNDWQMRYRRLPCEMFTDTLEASAVPWQRQN